MTIQAFETNGGIIYKFLVTNFYEIKKSPYTKMLIKSYNPENQKEEISTIGYLETIDLITGRLYISTEKPLNINFVYTDIIPIPD